MKNVGHNARLGLLAIAVLLLSLSAVWAIPPGGFNGRTGGSTGSSISITPAANATNAAASNVSLIQGALNAGGNIEVSCSPTTTTETDTIGSSPFQVAVANSGQFFLGNQSVRYSSGATLTQVTSSPSTGQYTVSSGGVYTFASGDTGNSVAISYTWAAPAWVNAPLVAGSNTALNINTGCHLEQLSGTNNAMIVTYSSTLPWATEYINSGLIANGPLSMISSANTPAWAQSTSYSKGNYAVANGNIYWENASSCTSAGTGSGPSGNSGTSTGPTGTTGAAISDGSCSWYYVTVNNASTNNLYTTVYFPNSGLTAGGWLNITPQPDTSSSNLWSGTQTAHTRGGIADNNYFGTFYVYAVNDSNWVTVVLKEQPASAFSGIPMNMRIADHDIYIGGGGILDYNTSGNPGGVSLFYDVALFIATAARVDVEHLHIINAPKYTVDFAGTEQATAGYIDNGAGSSSDTIKVQGAFDTTIHDIDCNGGDDCVTLEDTDVASFGSIYTNQNLINAYVRNVSSEKGASLGLYHFSSNLYEDGIVIDGGSVSQQAGTGYLIAGTVSGTAGTYGTVTFKNIDNRALDYLAINGNSIVNNLRIEVGHNSLGASGSQVMNVGSGATVVQADIYDGSFVNPGTAFNIQSGGVVNQLNLHGGFYNGDTGGCCASILVSNSGELDSLNFEDVTEENFLVIYQNVGSLSTAVSMTNSRNSGTFQGFSFGAGSANSVFVQNDVFNGTGYVAKFNGTATIKMTSGGGNVLTGTTWWNFGSGTDTASSYGWDILCDVTKMTRTTGEYCQNTNTSPGSGTLTTAGSVMDQGTSSGSWFLLANPSGQTY